MGLLAVSKFIKTKYPHLYHQEHLSLFAHHRVFMDIASYVYKYVCIMGSKDSRWLNAFVNLCLAFRKNGVLLTIVFDGKAPEAKADEQKSRRDMRDKQTQRTETLKKALAVYEHQPAELTPEERSTLKKEIENYNKRHDVYREPQPENADVKLDDAEVNNLHELVKSLTIQNSSLSRDDFADLKSLLSACGVCWMQAPAEAEAFCSWLVRRGYGTAVVSCDTDCLAHRADVVIFDVDSATGIVKYVNTKELLAEWGLTEMQLIDFGILCGCDYNPGSRVNKIGPATAIQLLQQYGTIDNLPLKTPTYSSIVSTNGASAKRSRDAATSGGYAGLVDLACLQHRMIRELFNPEYTEDTVEGLQSLTPSWDAVVPLLTKRPDLNQKAIRELIASVETKPVLKPSDAKQN